MVKESGAKDPLSVSHPALAKEALDWDPSQITYGSNKKSRWICNYSHEFTSTVWHRVNGQGCPYCAGKKVLSGFNDLLTTHAQLAKELVDSDPSTISMGSAKKHLWKCDLGHEWNATVKHRVRGQGCPFCAGQAILIGFNDLATTHPELAKELIGTDPKTLSMGTNKKELWQCELMHEFSASVSHRVNGKGCSYCAGKAVLPGFNDLATTHPELAKELVDSDPSTISMGSAKKHLWKCDLGHEWSSDVKHRVAGRGCPSCAQTGFDPNKDGWLYFLQHPDWEMLQIGITNSPDDRLTTHKHLGWEILELRGPMDGGLARQWETDILRMLRKKSAIVGSTEIAGRFTGFTESWIKDSYPVKSLRELMELVRLDEETK